MSLKVSVYIAQSLDGYIAREDGNLDWLDAYHQTIPEDEDLGYQAFMDSIDILVMGRNTYEKVLSFGAWPYGEKKVIVLSSHELNIPEHLKQTVTHSDESPKVLHQRLSTEGVGKIYIDGANTIQRFLRAGLVDELIITITPTLLGSGISLFGELAEDIQLELVSSQGYAFGFTQLTYTIKK